MLVVLIAVSLALAGLAFSYGGIDFGVYYAAARVTLQGGNPYDYQQLAPQIVSSAGKLNNPYYYAPWFTWSLLPLALLPYAVARVLWALINFILWFWALFNLSKLISYPKSGWRKWGMWTLVTFVFAWSTWGSEQVGVLVFFMLTFAAFSAERKNWNATGIWLALLLFKPNVTAIPVAAITLWLVWHEKKWKPALVMAGTLASLLVFSLVVSPNWHLALLQPDKIKGLAYTLDSSGSANITRYTATLLDWLKVYGIASAAAHIVYALVVALCGALFIFMIYKSQSVVQLTAGIVLVNFAALPYALFYDYPSLTLTLFYVNHKLTRAKWARLTMNALVAFSLFIGDKIPYRYWIVVILASFWTLERIVARRSLSHLEDNRIL
jgi:hypothetical protein